MSMDSRGYRPCVRIIIHKFDKVLLGERRYHDGALMYYEFPGGGIEQNDTIEDTVKKEALEEVGVVVENVRSLGLHFVYDISYTNPSRAKKYRGGEDVWYMADYVGTDHSVHGKEGDALPHRWVTFSEAIELIKNGPGSKYNLGRLTALRKAEEIVATLTPKLFETNLHKKPKISNW